jgi:hypothetical protein
MRRHGLSGSRKRLQVDDCIPIAFQPGKSSSGENHQVRKYLFRAEPEEVFAFEASSEDSRFKQVEESLSANRARTLWVAINRQVNLFANS